MPSSSSFSHHVEGLRLVRRDLVGAVPSPTGPPRRHHVVVVGADESGSPTGVGIHTAGLVEHLATRAASVTMLDAHRSGRRRTADGLGLLTGVHTAMLPHVPDVVLGVTPGLGGATAAARIALRHHVPLVLIVHDLVTARPDGTAGRGLTVAAAVERRLLRAATEVAVTCPEIGEHVFEVGVAPEHVHLLPLWAPDDVFPTDRALARRALGWPLRPATVVLAASPGARPDLATVGAAAELLEGEARVVVLDDASGRSVVPLQSRGPGRVRHVAPRDHAGVRRALAAADLLLLADRPDTTGPAIPSMLPSYLAAGRPVLAAVHEGGAAAAELERTAGAGLVTRPGDPRLMAAAIRALLHDTPLRAAMGEAAHRHAVDRLSRAGTMRQLDALLRGALLRSGTARNASGRGLTRAGATSPGVPAQVVVDLTAM